MPAMPPRCHLERHLRKYPHVAAPASDINIGVPLKLVAGELDVADAITDFIGFAAEPGIPNTQPEFTTGGAVAGAGGAFVVDVHPGELLVQLADPDNTFIMEYWGAGAGATGPAEPAPSIVGTDIALTANDATGGVAVVADAALTGTGAIDLGTNARIVSIVERPQGANTPGQPSGFSQVEVAIIDGKLFP